MAQRFIPVLTSIVALLCLSARPEAVRAQQAPEGAARDQTPRASVAGLAAAEGYFLPTIEPAAGERPSPGIVNSIAGYDASRQTAIMRVTADVHLVGPLRGANPNNVALSPDGRTLLVSNGGTNSVAVIALGEEPGRASQVVGLIPTGWYPSGVAVSHDGDRLYVVNAKSPAGPNPAAGRIRLARAP